jgi:hypothetical protein
MTKLVIHHLYYSFYCHVADILDNLRPVSPKLILPGHIEHVVTPLSPLTSHSGAAAPTSNASDQRLMANQRNCERFLKINVRHITDGQVGSKEDCSQCYSPP